MTDRDIDGHWIHPDDRDCFHTRPNTFNTDYPPGPFIGDIENAPIIILGLNGRYSSGTAAEFASELHEQAYLNRIHHPSETDWSILADYYIRETNFGEYISSGKAAVVNGCTYRSQKWSNEPDNQRFARHLPSCRFLREWLDSEIEPATRRGERLVVAWRWGSWRLKKGEHANCNFMYSAAPVSSRLADSVISAMNQFLRER